MVEDFIVISYGNLTQLRYDLNVNNHAETDVSKAQSPNVLRFQLALVLVGYCLASGLPQGGEY